MSSELPPNPIAFRDINKWARQFYEFYLAQTRIGVRNDPLPALLAHRQRGNSERAATAGILVYDPLTNEVVVSTSGDWCPVACAPSYTAAQLVDATSEANTLNKHTGRIVYDSTNATLAVANGPLATDTWSRLTVAATVTPT